MVLGQVVCDGVAALLREREAVLWDRIADVYDEESAERPIRERQAADKARAQAEELRELLALRAQSAAAAHQAKGDKPTVPQTPERA
ncbi:hypothetical protein [Yinghuangia sp. YIM S09857]|uniref:hypothetical protein n=1 Tax=Yinghuangia sp. YIM S09857 TaxID=3436929 RepID=UPI003F53B5D5